MATLDVLTLAEAKTALSNNAGTSNDDLLTSYVTGVSAYLDTICGPVVIREVSEELSDEHGTVFLTHRPVVAVTSVTEYADVTGTTLTEQTIGTAPLYGFQLNAAAGYLTRVSSGASARWACGLRNIAVTYTAGRYTNTAAVDHKFKRAAGFILANIYRREHGMAANYEGLGGVTYLLPNAAEALLTGEMLVGQ